MTSILGIATGARLNAGKLLDPTLDGIAASGAKAIRLSGQWDRVEANLGDVYDWRSVDPIVDGCEKRGLGLCLEAGTRDNNLYAPGMPAAFVKFHGALAQRYEGRIIATAGPNEPNHVKIAPNPDAKSYTQLILKPSYELIKKLAPSVTVLNGGLGGDKNDANDGNAADFLTAMYAAGAKGYFDGLAFHPYTHPLSPSESMTQQKGGYWLLHLARLTMHDNGDRDKLTWITEFADPTGGSREKSTEAQQAVILADAVAQHRKHWNAGPWFWFSYQDTAQDPLNYGDWMGIVRADGKHKASYDVFKKLAQ